MEEGKTDKEDIGSKPDELIEEKPDDLIESKADDQIKGNTADEVEEPKGCQPVSTIMNILKVVGAASFIYIFIFSIGLLSDSFQVLGGSFLNQVLAEIQGRFKILSIRFLQFCFRYTKYSVLWVMLRYFANGAMPELVDVNINIYYACGGRFVYCFTGNLLHHGGKYWYINY